MMLQEKEDLVDLEEEALVDFRQMEQHFSLVEEI